MSPSQRLLLPFVAALAGVALLSLMDALMKSASLAAGVYTASLLRSLLAAMLVAPVWLGSGFTWPRGTVMRLHIERGVVSALMALTFFYALTKLPIAEAIAISFVAPLLALYLANILLGERIGRTAIWASLLGFAGTLVIVGNRLGRTDFDEEVAWGLASLFVSALLYAYNFVVIRRQSQVAGPLEVATFHAGVGGLVQLLAAPFFFALPGMEALREIGFAAVLTVAASLLIAWSYARAEAQVLVPLEYTGFLWAALFGWLFFREPVTVPTLIGVVLIVIACWVAVPRARTEQTLEATD
ncbi:DMT family transporter [Aurantiacibacter aquimixticola]|uniref:DMT family transporter n=1 Tax=Aurantiacibacter aquimixticola TaxID=1958945 RepID=A0A419RTX8_9SPHN|nr:DMT family transporter [Aurantiacibacter aquimixticola]RJY09241.1 DMT family transporter [Aurantiacibacter aquimixticola]